MFTERLFPSLKWLKYALPLITFAVLPACSPSTLNAVAPSLTGPAPTPTPAPLSCPVGYVSVPADINLGTSEFCVAQFEMRNNGGVPASQAASVPWAGVSRNTAIAACQSLGANYDLIANNQWQATARNIAMQASNWSSGVVGSGAVNTSPGDYGGGGIMCDSTNEYTDPNCVLQMAAGNFNLKRTHTLSSGGIVWDMGANGHEVTKTLSTAGQYNQDACVSTLTTANPFSDVLGTMKDAFGLASITGFALSGCGGLGDVRGSSSNNTSVNRVVLRGGSFYDPSGIFTADIGWAGTADTDGSYVFRCVYK